MLLIVVLNEFVVNYAWVNKEFEVSSSWVLEGASVLSDFLHEFSVISSELQWVLSQVLKSVLMICVCAFSIDEFWLSSSDV